MTKIANTASGIARRLSNPLLLALAVIVVLFDDAFRAFVIPMVRALARLALMRRIEGAIAALPPQGILMLFVVPLAIIEPFKIYALYLFSQGNITGGVLTFVVAKVVGVGLAERLFAIGRDKLLSIRWFAWCHARILAIRDAVHAWLMQNSVWQRALRIVRQVRERLAEARAALKRVLHRAGRGRFAAARRRVRRYWTA